jgi:cell division protein FtsI/penicillin-binding protein 2
MTPFRSRFLVLIVCFFVVVVCIVGRLVFLMVAKHDYFLNRSQKQIQKLIKIDTSRGQILDRNLHPLAMSRPVQSVYASPRNIANKRRFSDQVAPHLNMTSDAVFQKINNDRTFVWLKRKLDDIDIAPLDAWLPQQLNVLQEERRVYPNNALLSDVLGFVGTDAGLGGLEYEFDEFLTGEHGYYIINGDPRGVRMISSNKQLIGRAKGFSQSEKGIEASSMKGGHVVLTIDYRVQFLVEQLLTQAIDRVEASSGQVIVMDVKNGDILAMANYPYFNPNQFQKEPHEVLKNSCIVDVFEPGSIFKIVTYAAALEEKMVTPGTILEVPETIVIARRRIKEAKKRKPDAPTHYTANDILVKSMNVGTTLLAQKMGANAFLSYIQAFGFGQKSRIHLPGETKGLLRSIDQVTPIDSAVMSFGQGIGVTSLQMIRAVSAIGNGGRLIEPRVVKHLTDHNHLTIYKPSQYREQRIVSSKTAKYVRDAMEDVVDNGSGRYAAVSGYRVGGKTGTAQKPLEQGVGYKEGAYIASFIGLLPIDQPQYAILVAIDEPGTTIWGSTAAAPLFSEVAKVLIDYFDVPPAKQ